MYTYVCTYMYTYTMIIRISHIMIIRITHICVYRRLWWIDRKMEACVSQMPPSLDYTATQCNISRTRNASGSQTICQQALSLYIHTYMHTYIYKYCPTNELSADSSRDCPRQQDCRCRGCRHRGDRWPAVLMLASFTRLPTEILSKISSILVLEQ